MNPDQTKEKEFWNNRWQNGETGWDIGYAAPAIAQYMQTYSHKNAAILIPGCGNAYEAEELIKQGFTNITLIDIAPEAVQRIQQKFAGNSSVQVLLGNFFDLEGRFDLILEQTFFCAIPPASRKEYVEKAASLLAPGGILAGLLFNRQFDQAGPPYGGTENEYRSLFSPWFHILKMEPCYNSIPPRAGSELFIEMVKK